MKLNLVLPFITAHLVASQCVIEHPEMVQFEKGECSYAKVLRGVKQIRNQLRGAGVTNCLSKEEELGALLNLSSVDDMVAKIESICNQAISRSRNDADYAVDFNTIPLIDSEDQTTINRFIKEFYDGGTFYNEEIQQRNADDKKKLGPATLGIKQFYQAPAKHNIVKWPSSETHNFDNCQYNTVMCCWVQDRFDDGNGDGNCAAPYPDGKIKSSELWTPDSCIDADPADNTDICYVDMSRSPSSNHVREGAVIFDDKNGVREGDAHCHGFAWADDELAFSHRYRGNNLFYVSMYDHLRERGYVRNVPGAPMCSCVENMPTVDRSDCTEMDVSENFSFEYVVGARTFHAKIVDATIQFNACQGANDNNNDLQAYYERLVDDDAIRDRRDAFSEYLVGEDNCSPAVASLLSSYGIVRN